MNAQRMSGRQPLLTDEQAAELARMRRTLEQLPTAEQLAERWGKPVKLIRTYLYGRASRVPKRHGHLLHADRS